MPNADPYPEDLERVKIKMRNKVGTGTDNEANVSKTMNLG
jgi:hypothetical protein